MLLSRRFHDTLDNATYTLEALLLLLSLAVGINDAAIFIDFHLFISNQTGNIVFIGVGSLIPVSTTNLDLRRTGLSLGGFLTGALILGQLGNCIGKRQRSWVVFSNFFQTLLMFIAAALKHWYATSTDRTDPRNLSVIFIMAFASGMQVEMAKGLGVPEIPTAMITVAMADLSGDPKLWQMRGNRSRNRRLFFIVTLLMGSFIGASTHEHINPAMPLLLAALIKTAVVIGFCFTPAVEPVVIPQHIGKV